MEHHFNVEIAKQYGIAEATFLNHIKFWTLQNLANRRNIKLGYCWTYNTLDAFTELFPYWNRRQIEHLINKLIDNGLLAKTNLNSKKYDRTCWYALTAKSFAMFPELSTANYVQLLIDSHESDKNLTDFNGKPLISLISQKCEMDFTKLGNGFHKNVTPIPDTNPYNKTDNKSFCDQTAQKSNISEVQKRQQWKTANEQKHSWAENQKKSPLADVTKQSTSYKPSPEEPPSNPVIREEHMQAIRKRLGIRKKSSSG